MLRRVCALTLLLPTIGAATGCNKGAATVTPDQAPPASSEEASAEPEPEPEPASPELIANYTALVHDVYARDASRCLEAQMDVEESRYMRSGYTLDLMIAADGTVQSAEAKDMMVQVRNYEGEVVKDGDTRAMGDCLVEAAKGWDFEPLPPSATHFEVSGSVGD